MKWKKKQKEKKEQKEELKPKTWKGDLSSKGKISELKTRKGGLDEQIGVDFWQ